MYSKVSFEIFSKFVQIAHVFGLIRFAWERRRHCFVYTQSRSRRIWEKVQLILLSCYIVFLTYQSLLLNIKAKSQGSVDKNDLLNIKAKSQ